MKKVITKNSKRLELKEYAQVLEHIKTDILQTQLRTALSVTKELTLLYWRIGKTLSEKMSAEKWGAKVAETLARDLGNAFPGIAGFSRANIYRMMAFYTAYPNCRTAARQIEDNPILLIPWGHNIILLEKLQNNNERLWYAHQIIENGWSRSTLIVQIKSNLYGRQGKAITNFVKTLPSHNSSMAQQVLKDPYMFDFLTLQEEHIEQDLEQGLVNNVQKLLLEMGKGFSFVARQYPIEVGGQDFYIDLLFYHTKLKCYVVVELKARAFTPSDAGQLNFYLSAVDDLVRDAEDKPTIGLLLCKTKNNFVAEYALRNIHSPIGVAEYETEILKKLPKELKSSLPSIEEIEAELEKTEILEAETKKTKKNSK